MPDFPETRHVLEPDCARCPALVESRERISWGTGPRDADVMVVGEAPGAGEPDAKRWRGGNWTGKAYTTRHSGRKIRSMFEALGRDAYYTNAVKCFPRGEDGSNREPAPDELDACFTYLETEIRRVDPAVVVTTGRHATSVVLSHEDIELDGFVDSVLEPVRCDRLGTTALPILHPSYQNVWLSRLGYDREAYVAELGERIAACL